MMYTTILKRPVWVSDCFSQLDHDIDVVCVVNEAHIGPREAAQAAQHELSMRDMESLMTLCVMTEKDKPKPKDYRVLVVIEGCHEPKLTGWDLLSDI